jgi:hypothetical protein
MSLETFTVCKKRWSSIKKAKTLASVDEVYNSADIVYAIPSVCYAEGVSDGLVNTEVLIRGTEDTDDVTLWVTQTVATIEALDD